MIKMEKSVLENLPGALEILTNIYIYLSVSNKLWRWNIFIKETLQLILLNLPLHY